MYCPICFNNSLSLKDHGVIRLEINSKHRNNNTFLFNIQKDTEMDLQERLQQKIDEFLQWYSTFQNKEPITKFLVFSPDFICKSNHPLNLDIKLSVIGLLYDEDDIIDILEESCEKYNIPLAEDLEIQSAM
ncbi:MAG: hypothetical protein ACOCUT_02180 [bacterium]